MAKEWQWREPITISYCPPLYLTIVCLVISILACRFTISHGCVALITHISNLSWLLVWVWMRRVITLRCVCNKRMQNVIMLFIQNLLHFVTLHYCGPLSLSYLHISRFAVAAPLSSRDYLASLCFSTPQQAVTRVSPAPQWNHDAILTSLERERFVPLLSL